MEQTKLSEDILAKKDSREQLTHMVLEKLENDIYEVKKLADKFNLSQSDLSLKD